MQHVLSCTCFAKHSKDALAQRTVTTVTYCCSLSAFESIYSITNWWCCYSKARWRAEKGGGGALQIVDIGNQPKRRRNWASVGHEYPGTFQEHKNTRISSGVRETVRKRVLWSMSMITTGYFPVGTQLMRDRSGYSEGKTGEFFVTWCTAGTITAHCRKYASP